MIQTTNQTKTPATLTISFLAFWMVTQGFCHAQTQAQRTPFVENTSPTSATPETKSCQPKPPESGSTKTKSVEPRTVENKALENKARNNLARTSSESFEVRDIEGWSVKVEKTLLNEEKDEGELALKALANHLQRIKFILPQTKFAQLQKLPIWLEHENQKLSSMQYHPGKGWLINNGHDPALAKHVHIPRSSDLTKPSMWAKHPYVILHELAHAYHDQVLGFNHREIREVFDRAKESGKYNRILDHRGNQVKHYGMNNDKEFFAEATEAYLGVNDFYPFVRAEMKQFDPDCFKLMEKIWGKIR